jgi:ADP-heptose:LPS heptosyltransferase
VRSPLHEAQLNFELLRPLGISHIPVLDEIPALYGLTAPRLPQVDALRALAPFNVILHPKSNGNGREWPLERYVELALRLKAEPGICLWITGSAAEGELLARAAPALLALPHVRNLCGQFDLAGLTALIGAADGLVASGTGPLHIASALGQNALGLFPPIKPIDPARWGALGAQARSLSAPARCASCTGAAACNCMDAIGAGTVAQIVLDWRARRLREA